MRMVSLASLQSCLSVDNDTWCKRELTFPKRFVHHRELEDVRAEADFIPKLITKINVINAVHLRNRMASVVGE